jgi:FkbM family methyltransferase
MFIQEEITNKFLNMQKILKPDISIEVGAYDADFSKLIARSVSKAYAFEASPEVYEKFKDYMENIVYINKAVSNYNGTTQFNIDVRFNPSDVGHNGIKKTSINNWVKESFEIDVECVALDSHFNDLDSNNVVLWIDCEGANREVLTGANNLLKNVSSIFIETETEYLFEDAWSEENVIHYLEEKDFSLVYREEAYKNQYNCIFIKQGLITKDILSLYGL